MSILNSALNQIWSSSPYSFSLALSLYSSNVMCYMHLNINLCYIFVLLSYYVSSDMYFLIFLLLHRTTTHCTYFISKRLWVYQNENSEEKLAGHICTLISGNYITVPNINLVYLLSLWFSARISMSVWEINCGHWVCSLHRSNDSYCFDHC